MLKDVLKQKEFLVVPGVGTPVEARMVRSAGFDAVYVSGYAAAGAMHGVPDIGLMGLEGICDVVRRVSLVCDLPIIVDADTGYGDVANVMHTVRALESAGASAVQLEDQKWPKRCGHLDGKLIEDRDVAQRKISAAVNARSSDDLLIIARTDAVGPLGLDEALVRVELLESAGADLTFVDAPPDEKSLSIIGSHGSVPRIVNMSESGKTPILDAGKLHEIGFSLVLYPTSLLRAFSNVGRRILATLKNSGSTLPMMNDIDSLDSFNELVGFEKFNEFERLVVDKFS